MRPTAILNFEGHAVNKFRHLVIIHRGLLIVRVTDEAGRQLRSKTLQSLINGGINKWHISLGQRCIAEPSWMWQIIIRLFELCREQFRPDRWQPLRFPRGARERSSNNRQVFFSGAHLLESSSGAVSERRGWQSAGGVFVRRGGGGSSRQMEWWYLLL